MTILIVLTIMQLEMPQIIQWTASLNLTKVNDPRESSIVRKNMVIVKIAVD